MGCSLAGLQLLRVLPVALPKGSSSVHMADDQHCAPVTTVSAAGSCVGALSAAQDVTQVGQPRVGGILVPVQQHHRHLWHPCCTVCVADRVATGGCSWWRELLRWVRSGLVFYHPLELRRVLSQQCSTECGRRVWSGRCNGMLVLLVLKGVWVVCCTVVCWVVGAHALVLCWRGLIRGC